MPSHEEHCQHSLKRYGKRFDELHHWIDEQSTLLGSKHRLYRHDPATTPVIAKKLFGEFADQACLDHIRLDDLEKRKKLQLKRKNPKQGYWKTHKYRKTSMDKIVKDYWGDDFLESLIKTSDDLRRISNEESRMKRDRALIASLFLTGGRVSEVLKLRKKNFIFDNEEAERNNAFLVKELGVLKQWKNKKRLRVTRTFPIWNDDPLVNYLREWLDELDEADDLLFLGDVEGRPTLTYIQVYYFVTNVGKRLEVPYHITPAWFRKQREYHLVKKRRFSVYDLQAYLKLKKIPDIYRQREDWQNLLAIARPLRKEKFYQKAPFDALRDIQGLLQLAKNEVCIVDPYVDDSIFDLYLTYVNSNASIKLITKNMYRKFKEVAERFKIQQTNFEVRSTDNIHDRYLIMDDRVWIMGNSLNRAGIKPFYIIELVDKDRVIKWFKRLWKYAKTELS